MAVLPDGRILLAGSMARGVVEDLDLSAKNNTSAMRLLPDDTPDPAFGSPGSPAGVAVIDHGAIANNSDDIGTTLLQGNDTVVADYARAAGPDLDDGLWND